MYEDFIAGALKKIEEKTCIQFVKRTTEKEYLRFVHDSG